MANYIYTNDGLVNTDELAHYGVPGMKWGVRKSRPTSSSDSRWPFWPKRKQMSKSDNNKQTKSQPIKKKKLSELTDKEIKARMARMELERSYIEMVKGNKKLKLEKSKPVQKPQKRKLSELTNEELQAKIDRMNLENRYKELAKTKNPPKSREGRDYALDILKNIGKNTLVNIGTQAANKALGLAINKAFGADPYDPQKRIVNPNKGQTDKK